MTPEGVERFRAGLRDLSRTSGRRWRAAAVRDPAGRSVGERGLLVGERARPFGGRILQLQALLRNAVVLPADGGTGARRDTVQVGCKVTVVEDGSEPETYHLVGPAEASPKDGRISHASPLGQALMGRRAGERVLVPAPAGSFEVRIVGIE
jgi:transcription elongation factor GreA